jgi:DNA-binding Lrp family transcriptional regulator
MGGLEKLMGGNARMKLLRLFLFNPQEGYAKADAVERLRIPSKIATRELAVLEKAGVIKRRTVVVEKKTARGVRKVKAVGWIADLEFPFFAVLQKFMVDTTLLAKDEIVTKLRSTGKIGLLIISGVFARQWDARLDLLIVGDRIDTNALTSAIRAMEAELGRELHFATLTTAEFYYRRSIQDRLIRDVVDFPHEILIDRIGAVG